MTLNIKLAQELIDGKPGMGDHLYVDERGEVRDKHIENLFRDLFGGLPLDDIFRTNFEVYFQELINDKSAPIFRGIYLDAATAKRWFDTNIGTVKVRELNRKERAEFTADDPEYAPLKYVATSKSMYASRLKPAYAPSQLHAILLAAVFVYRAQATKRLAKFFAPARK